MIQPASEWTITPDDYLPARLVSKAVYCPRLFYLMHVEGVVEREADFLRSLESCELDGDEWDSPDAREDDGNAGKPFAVLDDGIHSQSLVLAAEALGVVAHLDLIEAAGSTATPVDYKPGRPKRDSEGNLDAWLHEKIQLCLQALVLREHGFTCNHGILFLNQTRQQLPVDIDEALIRETRFAVDLARQLGEQTMPPEPLVDSPKCSHCPMSAICMPDETNRCRPDHESRPRSVRLPASPRDELRPVYLNTQGAHVGKQGEILRVKKDGKVIGEVRLREVSQVNLMGNIQVSTQALTTLLALNIPLVMMSSRGYFRGMLQGAGLKNIVLRREQFRVADDPSRCLQFAKWMVSAKVLNSRVLMQRNHFMPPRQSLKKLKQIADRVARVESRSELLGLEGNAARIYFEHFSGLIKAGQGCKNSEATKDKQPVWSFDFLKRSRRPPRDPVNAMLSLVYSLLMKDLTVTTSAIGLDPFQGFYHQIRPGRPALSLDLMEPFRPLIADSVVITAINNRMVTLKDFVASGRGVTITDSGRKSLFRAYELRMDQLVTHPLFDYRVSYRRLIDIQTRLAAKWIRGELDEIPCFVSR